MEHADAVGVILRDDGFRDAFVIAAAGTALVWALARLQLAQLGFGVPAVVATFVGVARNAHISLWLVIAVAALGAGATIGGSRAFKIRLAATLPGAVLISAALPGDLPRWMPWFAAVFTVLAAPLATSSNQCFPRVTPALLAISAVGVYWCVPDTEQALALLGAMLPTAILTADRHLAPDRAGVAALAGLFVWTSTVGGAARPGSVVAGAMCLGVLLVIPLVEKAGVIAIAATHIALVAIAARGAGRVQSATAAGLILALSLAGAVVGLRVLSGPRHPWSRRGS
jgi:hypothetical protein